jgi:hypothetical protein
MVPASGRMEVPLKQHAGQKTIPYVVHGFNGF